jgi:2-polyprenyl-6-methoxyphenol hydroxylase-like FAD-dependent oxidoreductase
LDWIWYDICDVDAEEFKNIMTDKEGRRRRTTVPRGYIQQEVWQKRLGNALEIVGDDWFNIMSETTDPFVTNITDLQSEKACFLGGKLLLVGEAFSQFRPHVGLSSNLAALQALSLARVLKGEQTLAMWETDAIGYAQKLGETSTAFGLYGLSGQHRGWASD